jgi:hypothetical protein
MSRGQPPKMRVIRGVNQIHAVFVFLHHFGIGGGSVQGLKR